ncbi:M48 family metallopeptidase [Capnocytophaga catalasegens]|uniref:Peptidase M48 n=1 Tax=Capnocytophaga catalasegens TaxID=1004260 RepID=A0AAV5AYA9_9FLAO|nr:M48 family metallopeptidase [Capnocytophaga catalasegens]GIZ15368.1 peptidase M48 [Capnocytophaga catalasegens]GJM50956.1 peptidase M48 [Capnocytophaga catalasegens]GJM52140.1 peptidase M48 [Capnocytophaga catalasegens]
MKKIILVTLLLAISACKTNPFTGKSTLNFTPNSTLFPTSFAQYNQFLKEHKVIKGTAEAEMIKRVGQRIAKAAELWLDRNGYKGYLNDYRWEYNLVDSKEINAWCMPGGKIVFYTGILPITKNERGIAVVMGHEVAHALADHGAQRMSASTLQQIGAVAGNLLLNEKYRNTFNTAYGIGTQVGVMLPFSRSHETEADAIGLQIMAIAGYDPDEGAKLWERMSQASGGGSSNALLSTHPSNESRIAHLKQLAPKVREEAKKYGITRFE